ncbi:MAG: cyclic nucleotide-binding domain-containing protein [Chloroflexota bacterium]|nr:cyclic nucleotide-binding domain-containing protein [Chloroflexota bacterium]
MEANEIQSRLAGFPVFSKWTQEDLRRLAQGITVEEYQAEEAILPKEDTQGDLSDDAYVINQGTVRQFVEGEHATAMQHRTLAEGDVFIDQTLFRGKRYSSAATAETWCELFRINSADLGWALNKYPDLWKRLIQPDSTGRLRAIPLLRSLTDAHIEYVAQSVGTSEFKAGDEICKKDDEDGALWIIDWGQVEITDQGELDLSGGMPGVLQPSDTLIEAQGFDLLKSPRLTSGNWFLGGLSRVPGYLTTSAMAATAVRLLRVPAHVLESLVIDFPDVLEQLGDRIRVEEHVRKLGQGIDFDLLNDDHWRQIAGLATMEHVPSGLNVTRQGDLGHRWYSLFAGGAVIRVTDEEGRERPQRYVTAPYSFGLTALLKGDRRDATVRSITTVDNTTGESLDGSDWVILDRADLRMMLQQDLGLWRGTRLKTTLMEPEEKKRFDWMEEDEVVAWWGRRHPIALLPALMAPFVLWAVGLLIFWLLNIEVAPLAAIFVLFVMLIVIYPIPIANYLDDHYAITNKRVTRRERTLMLRDTRVEAPLERIQETTLNTDLMGRIFDYGDLSIQTAATIGRILFEMVPEPETVENILRFQKQRVEAGRQAAQREGIRAELVKRLNLRIAPKRGRALPEGMKPVPRTAYGRFKRDLSELWQRWAGAWRRAGKGAQAILVRPLPESSRQRVLRGGRRKPKKRDDDDIVYRKHWWFLFKRVIITFPLFLFTTFLLTMLVIQMLGGANDVYGIDANSAFFLTFIAWLILGFIVWFKFENWRNDKYILTERYIIDVEALPFGLREQRRQASWDRIQNAIYDVPSLWANILDYGSVLIQTAATESAFTFENVGHPRQVQQEIFKRLEYHRIATEDRKTSKQQRMFGETLQVYDELMLRDGWATQSQRGYAPPGAEGLAGNGSES